MLYEMIIEKCEVGKMHFWFKPETVVFDNCKTAHTNLMLRYAELVREHSEDAADAVLNGVPTFVEAYFEDEPYRNGDFDNDEIAFFNIEFHCEASDGAWTHEFKGIVKPVRLFREPREISE